MFLNLGKRGVTKNVCSVAGLRGSFLGAGSRGEFAAGFENTPQDQEAGVRRSGGGGGIVRWGGGLGGDHELVFTPLPVFILPTVIHSKCDKIYSRCHPTLLSKMCLDLDMLLIVPKRLSFQIRWF